MPRALRGRTAFACPPPAALHLADKRQFAAACRAAGLRTPQTVTLCCPADAPAAAAVWLAGHRQARGTKRPTPAAISRGGARCISFRTPPGCGKLLAAAAQGGYFGSWLVQEYIPARTRGSGVVNAYCAADGSVPWLVQGQPPLQERTPEGTGNYAAVLVEPSRQDAALLDALRGLCRRRAGTALPILI